MGGSMRYLIVLLVLGLMAGCASIKHQAKVSQPFNEIRVAGVGDSILEVTTEKSLPNAFGKADIFGRTTPTKKTIVTFEGVKEGKAYFYRRSIDIETGATTMNSSPIVTSNTSTTTHTGMVGGIPYAGHSTTQGPTTITPPNTPEPRYFARNGYVIEIDSNSLPKTFVTEGTSIKVISADKVSVKYILEK
jgi:hypothetical protein